MQWPMFLSRNQEVSITVSILTFNLSFNLQSLIYEKYTLLCNFLNLSTYFKYFTHISLVISIGDLAILVLQFIVFLVSLQFSRATIISVFQLSTCWTKYTKVVTEATKMKKNLWIGSYLKWSKYLLRFL